MIKYYDRITKKIKDDKCLSCLKIIIDESSKYKHFENDYHLYMGALQLKDGSRHPVVIKNELVENGTKSIFSSEQIPGVKSIYNPTEYFKIYDEIQTGAYDRVTEKNIEVKEQAQTSSRKEHKYSTYGLLQIVFKIESETLLDQAIKKDGYVRFKKADYANGVELVCDFTGPCVIFKDSKYNPTTLSEAGSAIGTFGSAKLEDAEIIIGFQKPDQASLLAPLAARVRAVETILIEEGGRIVSGEIKLNKGKIILE